MRALVPDEIIHAIRRGVIVVTAHERAARGVRQAWDAQERARGMRSWESAPALSWRAWLSSLWRGLLVDGKSDLLLLNAAQEHRLWQTVLAADPEAQGVSDHDALGTLCAEAYRRVHSYDAAERLATMRPRLRGDTASFARWMHLFDQHCRRKGLLPEALLAAEIARQLRAGDLPASGRELLLVGFDLLQPAQEAVLSAWRQRGGVAEVLPAPSLRKEGYLVGTRDTAEELRGFARWARQLLERAPETRIALVVADLANERDEIESVLREILSPELEDITQDAEAAPFEFSLGRSLLAESIVRVAFDLLEWTQGPLALDRIEQLLLSSWFVATTVERAARASLGVAVRSMACLHAEATISEVLRLAEPSGRLASLRSALRSLERVATSAQSQEQRSFTGWVDHVRSVLEAARWATDLPSREYQVRERWDGVLDTLSTLDFAGEQIRWNDFSAALRLHARDTVFAPQAHDASVQVLGPGEAAGSQFDALWVLHAGEMDWPPRQAAHPLLPRSMELASAMPGVDRERERRRGRDLTQRLAGSAEKVVFSYTERTAGGSPQRASRDVAGLRFEEVALSQIAPEETASVSVELERVADAERIAPLRERRLRGGVRVLELQAQCGFRAFAEMRLHARELEQPSLGLSPAERGSGVHRALEVLWRDLGSQDALRALSDADRSRLVEQAIDAGLAKSSDPANGAWGKAYLDVQRQRLRRLLNAWLTEELRRPAFVVVQQEAKGQPLAVGPLELSLRMDRVDVVDGARVLLDYKTGPARTSQWRGDRPDLPQVPLYAVLAGAQAAGYDTGTGSERVPPLGAVAFANVTPGQGMGIHGFEHEGAGLLPPQSRKSRMDAASFQEQVQRWGKIVARLATEFAEGDARVRPKQFPTTCDRCGLQLLCRVDGTSFEEAIAEDHGPAHAGEEVGTDD